MTDTPPQQYHAQLSPYPQQSMQAPAVSRPPGTNGFAIAALVFGILGGIPLSVIFGIVALVKIRKTGQSGKGLAIAGLALSGVWLLMIVAGAVYGGKDGNVSVDRLHPGDCIKTLSESETVYRMPVVPCTQPHQGEVYGEFDLSRGDYPGETAIETEAFTQCETLLEKYAPQAVDSAGDTFYLYPRSADWRRGDRTVTCIAYSDPAVTGSLKD
ncbi:septum formation family protein [Actinokineospora sp.]|uniref:DUF4190 domain-containing protein n=1 Tax=Actinokineospora sp. TaxID=1872133 RepID=UPI003D6B39F9